MDSRSWNVHSVWQSCNLYTCTCTIMIWPLARTKCQDQLVPTYHGIRHPERLWYRYRLDIVVAIKNNKLILNKTNMGPLRKIRPALCLEVSCSNKQVCPARSLAIRLGHVHIACSGIVQRAEGWSQMRWGLDLPTSGLLVSLAILQIWKGVGCQRWNGWYIGTVFLLVCKTVCSQ